KPIFAMELLACMGSEVARSEYHNHSFCQKNVRERLAEGLLILKNRFGEKTADGWLIATHLTRSEFSSWIGAAKETVIRGLTDFKDEGLIRQDGDALILLKTAKLTEIAGL